MKEQYLFLIPLFVLVAMAGLAATPLVDGVIHSNEYNAYQIAAQSTQTDFTDNTDSSPREANGNELNSLSIGNDDQFLYVGIAGNLQSDANRLIIFFDLDDGGGRGSSVIPKERFGEGSRLPLEAEFNLRFNQNSSSSDFPHLSIDMDSYGIEGVSPFNWIGYIEFPGDKKSPWKGELKKEIGMHDKKTYRFPVARNESNTDGVSRGTGPADSGRVRAANTGFEFGVERALLDVLAGKKLKKGDRIRLYVGIATHDAGLWSNQYLPGFQPGGGGILGDNPVTLPGPVAKYIIDSEHVSRPNDWLDAEKGWLLSQRTGRPMFCFFCRPDSAQSDEVKTILDSSQVASFLSRYVLIKIDASTPSGMAQSKKFNVFKIPSLVILSPQGEVKASAVYSFGDNWKSLSKKLGLSQ